MVKDYKSLYLKYKNKYIHAKKHLKGGFNSGSQSFDSKSDPFEVSALTIDPGTESSNDSILLPPSPSRKEPTTPTPKAEFEPIFNHRIEKNRYVSYQKPIQFIFEKINFIRCEKNKFVTIFTSKIPSGYKYYFKIGDLEKNVNYEEISPLILNRPMVHHDDIIGGSGYITFENIDFKKKREDFIDRQQIKVGNQNIYLFVNKNYRLFYFIDKNPKFIGKMESELLIDNKGPNNEQLEDPILNRRQKILNSQKKID